MFFKILADLIVILHFAYVAFVVLGLLITIVGWLCQWQWIRNRWFRGVHLLMILVVVLEAWAGIICPLTTWEKTLRTRAGQETYQADFIANWFHEVLFFEAQPWVFTVAYTSFGAAVLVMLWLAPPRWRRNNS